MLEWVIYNIIIPFGIGSAIGFFGMTLYNLVKKDR